MKGLLITLNGVVNLALVREYRFRHYADLSVSEAVKAVELVFAPDHSVLISYGDPGFDTLIDQLNEEGGYMISTPEDVLTGLKLIHATTPPDAAPTPTPAVTPDQIKNLAYEAALATLDAHPLGFMPSPDAALDFILNFKLETEEAEITLGEGDRAYFRLLYAEVLKQIQAARSAASEEAR